MPDYKVQKIILSRRARRAEPESNSGSALRITHISNTLYRQSCKALQVAEVTERVAQKTNNQLVNLLLSDSESNRFTVCIADSNQNRVLV